MRKIAYTILMVLACWFAARAASAAELSVPARVAAGEEVKIHAGGSGSATLYLFGPAGAIKREVNLGGDIVIKPEDVIDAGQYTVIIGGDSATFWVTPNKTARLSFITHPSRLPVAVNNGIGGVVYTFDKFHNLVTDPQPVKFELAEKEGGATTRTLQTKEGMAFIGFDSGRKEGPAQFVASVGDVTEKRIVQQVASDPCNLSMHADRTKDGVEVSTAPIRDCTGNPVPDGTIVTFTATSKQGKSSVDARIKKGIAKADFPDLHDATISVASGVVMGNEIHVGGGE
ncbi:MAG: hypothetical protein ACRD3E_13770 [Terriglobales bacterium]